LCARGRMLNCALYLQVNSWVTAILLWAINCLYTSALALLGELIHWLVMFLQKITKEWDMKCSNVLHVCTAKMPLTRNSPIHTCGKYVLLWFTEPFTCSCNQRVHSIIAVWCCAAGVWRTVASCYKLTGATNLSSRVLCEENNICVVNWDSLSPLWNPNVHYHVYKVHHLIVSQTRSLHLISARFILVSSQVLQPCISGPSYG
jgi:hypothetical protein